MLLKSINVENARLPINRVFVSLYVNTVLSALEPIIFTSNIKKLIAKEDENCIKVAIMRLLDEMYIIGMKEKLLVRDLVIMTSVLLSKVNCLKLAFAPRYLGQHGITPICTNDEPNLYTVDNVGILNSLVKKNEYGVNPLMQILRDHKDQMGLFGYDITDVEIQK